MKTLNVTLLLAGAAVMCAVPASLQLSRQGELTVSFNKANAEIGRPLTPGSIAGVNRRMERRAARRAYRAAAGNGYEYGSGYGYGLAAAGVAAGAAVAANTYDGGAYNTGYWNGGYGTGAGLEAYAAATTNTYGGQGYGWNWDTKAYPPRAIYSSSYPPGSYFGPVCNPQVDNFCQ
jgi:hypothetical protein